MNGNGGRNAAPIELEHESDFELGFMTVRPAASEIVVDGAAQRLEPRVMQTLVALVQAGGEVVSRDDLMARCWHGAVVNEEAVTRAVGQVRRLSRQAPGSFTLETIADVGYRLMPARAGESTRAVPARAFEPRAPAFRWGRPLGLVIAAAVVLAAGRLLLPGPNVPSPALLDDGTPPAWRGHVMRGFQHVFAGEWAAAERALANAREGAPASASGTVAALQTALYGSVGRIADSLDVVLGEARSSPLSRDQSRVLQQWLDRSGRHDEAEAEYVRSRDLPGDRSAMELAAVVRALASRDANVVRERYQRYRETDWGRPGDDELFAVIDTPAAALEVLRRQIRDWRSAGSMPPFFAAAWASYYGDLELASDGLRASPESLFSTGGLLWDFVFAELRRTAAFKQLVRDFGYVDYWRESGSWGDFCRPVGDTDFECS